MINLRDLPIRKKLMLIIMLISSVSLLLASLAFIVTDRKNTRQAAGNNLATIAEIISANSSAAVIFGDMTAAEETLDLLEHQENIQSAAIILKNNTLFAHYNKSGFRYASPDLTHKSDEAVFHETHVDIFTHITYDGEHIGYVYLRSDNSDIKKQTAWHIILTLSALFVSLLVAYVLSSFLQKFITNPILHLSSIARRITTEKNYTLRVVGNSKDELGSLITDFNEMLEEIQLRDTELKINKEMLEERVSKRTEELEVSNMKLEEAKVCAETVAQEMKHQAHHDTLTGLPNRILLNDRINNALAHANREGNVLAILFLDLDRFKIINDSLGHAVGDELLKSVASGIISCTRNEDTVARLGGDEFVVLLSHISGAGDAGKIARKIIDVLAEPVICHGHELAVTTSIGISIYPYDGSDANTLMKNADISMYRAKELGRNKHIYYTAEMNAESRKQLAIETNLRKALDRNELYVLYQPKIDITTNRIVGAEALLRWEHPTMGLISPEDFIPVAEDSGLIIPIGEWVLNRALQQQKIWHNEGYTGLKMAINISSVQLSRPGLISTIEQALLNSGISPKMVEVEITENVVMQNIDHFIATLDEIKNLGINISMDDFGTGYSSLSYLRKLPIDTVKIDRSFVRNIPHDKEDVSIAQAIIAMSKSLGLQIVAEGVENIKQVHFFKQQGCSIVQGFLFSKPVSGEDFKLMLDNQDALNTINAIK
jgi:diguanylate cyclase (GGDEF)-like protein